MTELEQAREEKSELYRWWKQVRNDALDTRDPAQRRREQERARVLREMYQEACQRLRRLEGVQDAPTGKKSPQLDVNVNCGAVWADLEGMTWNKLDGRSWNDLPGSGSGRQMKRVQELVRSAMTTCTPRQLVCLNAYYGEGLTLEEIGERLGVDFSTVGRTLRRGRDNIQRYITARLLLSRCVDTRGKFDYMKFLNSARVLTERQKEMVFLILARDTSCRDIAEYVGRTVGTVERTARRAGEKLGALSVTVDAAVSAVTVERRDWAGRSEKELAETLGLTAAFYYRVVRRGETVDGVPLLHCAILNRLSRGEEPKKTAAELGCSVELVKRVRKRYGGRPLPQFRENYRPRKTERVKAPENPFAAVGDAVIDRIDAATWQTLQERFCHAGT